MQLAMSNSTKAQNGSSRSPAPRSEQLQFQIPVAVDCILLAVALWLGISLLIYGIKTNRFLRRSKSDFNGGVVYLFAFLSAVAMAARLVSSLLLFILPQYAPSDGDRHCSVMYDITVVMYVVGAVPVYLLLWLRQRVLYSHPSMAKMSSKLMVALSWGSLFFLVGAGLCLGALYAYPDNITSGYYGCIVKDSGSSLPNILTACVLVIGQVMLLWLFISPLQKHATSTGGSLNGRRPGLSQKIIDNVRKVSSIRHWGRGDLNSAAESQDPSHGQTDAEKSGPASDTKPETDLTLTRRIQKRSRSAVRIRRILRRSVIFGVICVSTDLLTLVLTSFVVGSTYPKNLPFMFYDLSLFANVVCIILSFDNYKSMAFAPCMISFKDTSQLVHEGSSRVPSQTTPSDT